MSLRNFVSILMISAVSFAAETVRGSATGMVVHEWGTFTSVAAADGSAVPWTVLAGAGDLPCFVERLAWPTKATAHARVRMETPVLYFYTERPATVTVGVEFPQGGITEWFPPAAKTGQRLAWEKADVLPGNRSDFPVEPQPSHYYAARATDAAPVRVGKDYERFLFYRGIGDFEVALRPRFEPGGAIGLNRALPAILFENRGGRVGFRAVEGMRVAPPELTGSVEDVGEALVKMLTGAGLYGKEARAMVATWRDSWFEEGMRLLYLVPREEVDGLLPLRIEPRPQSIERVFVGRVELLSPAMRDTIRTALADHDEGTLRRYGRFLDAFASQMPEAAGRDARERVLRLIAAPRPNACAW